MIDPHALIHEFIDSQNDETLIIGVIGDVLLDEYYNVSVDRISPEFPVPVMLSSDGEPARVLPGGAALVAWHLTPFNADVTLFGCIDQEAKDKISGFGFHTEHEDIGRLTPRKRRFYDQDFAGPRWDIEDLSDMDGERWKQGRSQLLNKIEAYVEDQSPDILILSDYGKGLFYDESLAQKIFALCNKFDIPTLVDPKHGTLEQWQGCTIFKPNHKEATQFAEQHDAYLDDLPKLLGCEAVIVTANEDGVYTYPANSLSYHYKPCKPVSGHPLGYSGAGDCFAAAFAVAYSSDFDLRESSVIANHVSSVYVQHKYTNPVTVYQLYQHIEPTKSKIFDDVGKLLQHLPTDGGMKVALANGCFDLLHISHVNTLKYGKENSDILVVAVNGDESIRKLKGNGRPVISLKERMQLLASLSMVDYVISFDEDTPYELIKKIRPFYIVKGGDYANTNIVGNDIAKEIIIAPYTKGNSTSNIIDQIFHARNIPHTQLDQQ